MSPQTCLACARYACGYPDDVLRGLCSCGAFASSRDLSQIGVTRSGAPIYADGSGCDHYTRADHIDAALAHEALADGLRETLPRRVLGRAYTLSPTQNAVYRLSLQHAAQGMRHRDEINSDRYASELVG